MNFLHLKSKTVGSAAIILGISALGSRFLGLIRDRILAGKFGAGDELDIYFAAFRIPDLVFNVLIAGAVASAFIPVFVEIYKKDKKEAWETASNFINTSLFILISISSILIIFTPLIMPLVAPGFSGEKMGILSNLTRVIFISPIFLALSAIFGSILNSFKRFLAYALAPLMYNLGIIFGALVLVDYFGIYGLGFGVILGAFAHFLVQVPSVLFSGFRWRAVLSLFNPNIKRIIKLMIPRSIGLGAFQVNLWVTTAIASTLSVGSVALYNLANNIQYIPIGVMGLAYATAVFPSFSHFAAERDYVKFTKEFKRSFWRIIFLSGVAAILLFVFREFIARIILEAGEFSSLDTKIIGYLLGFFAIGIVPHSIIPIISRAFYALQNTKTPVFINIAGIALNISLAAYFVFVLRWDLIGLAFAFSIAGIVNAAVLFFVFQRFLAGKH